MQFNIENSLGFLVNRTNKKMKNEFLQNLKPYDVTPEQWALLNRLWEEEGISSKELAELTCKDQPNIARILDKLEKKELIFRRPNPSDNRSFLLYLTDRGRELEEKLIPLALSTLEKALEGIEKEQVEELKLLLNRIYANLE
ncbi:MarR family winged helix-turn-helix transcriptional regulator [Desulforamulus aeronauticus]|uniref:Transcriptional regulator, MarR family n=1 Tax=Desulforamulus aeronauticus DSM 10349 TaxID=1121421 RepID=A0A1M6S686_9FIRM|nr:MarR family transcriptional regulator [Desulforamulus aeronauticus]SHK40206.1 transcriptional regulator, MarR family [Desulforamulus aeronauticus DSM 10349]